jgi:hypothetical protein
MKLPGGVDAIVNIAKLRDYYLDPSHLRGRHKARILASALSLMGFGYGIRQIDAEFLRLLLLGAAQRRGGGGGTRMAGDIRSISKSRMALGRATVRSLWIIRHTEAFPGSVLNECLKGHHPNFVRHAQRYAQEHGVFTFTSVTVYEIVYGLDSPPAWQIPRRIANSPYTEGTLRPSTPAPISAPLR